ncbi:hypothetical protein [Salinicola halophilus]|uniref:hypothetical protein n=1 Tax=Salinicola halophilus TaxID=184065 RepID=UPI000DA216AC|nr:hypothetical protein [Salinicola halophilus]
MKTVIAAASLATLLAFSAGSAFAQSAAMQEAYDANDEPLAAGSGITASGDSSESSHSGHSDATNEALDAVQAETDEATGIANAPALDELNAQGQSVQAGDALKTQ